MLGFGWDTAGGRADVQRVPAERVRPSARWRRARPASPRSSPDTNPDQIGNPFGQFAAQAGAQPGVLGIFDTNFTNGPLGCSVQAPFGTAYVYGSGNQSASNSYNISPGSPGSAWKVPVTQADCNVENPGVGGGPSGFGVLETSEATSTTVYHRFDAATMKFDTPLVTVAKQSELDAALSQDGAGGIYGTYLLDGAGGPINLSYSADGGKSFSSGVLRGRQGRPGRQRDQRRSTAPGRAGRRGPTTARCSPSPSRPRTRSRRPASAAAPRTTARRSPST